MCYILYENMNVFDAEISALIKKEFYDSKIGQESWYRIPSTAEVTILHDKISRFIHLI